MGSIEDALVKALKQIEVLEERISSLEDARKREQFGFWRTAFTRLANQDMIRGMLHTEILRSAGLLASAPLGDIEASARARFVDDPGYTLEPHLAELNLQAVLSEMRGEYRTPDELNPMFNNQD